MNSVVATLVAMVIFFTVFAARAPAMGNSADRAWQLSQLMEGVSTACNPNHGSLSCVQARRCVSKQIGRHDAACHGYPRCVSRSPEARCFRVVARAVRVSQPAVLSALLVIHTNIFLKRLIIYRRCCIMKMVMRNEKIHFHA